MLLKENFSEEYIRSLQKDSKRDPVLLERTVYAFGLLEALARVRMPFIFKGGTCLMMLMDKPRRLSTDIDIIVEPGTDLDDYLEKASAIFPFQMVEEQKRVGKNNIEKRHFKFTYDSPINNKQFYILLDVLFENNHYAEVETKEIRNDLLLTEEEYLTVKIPSADCILADKLTAFAPHTTGVELNKGKDMEVMKQLYDVCSLIEVFKECDVVKRTYEPIALAQHQRTAYGTALSQLYVLRHEARSEQRSIRYMLKVYVTYVDIFMQKTIVRKLQQGEQPWLCTW